MYMMIMWCPSAPPSMCSHPTAGSFYVMLQISHSDAEQDKSLTEYHQVSYKVFFTASQLMNHIRRKTLIPISSKTQIGRNQDDFIWCLLNLWKNDVNNTTYYPGEWKEQLVCIAAGKQRLAADEFRRVAKHWSKYHKSTDVKEHSLDVQLLDEDEVEESEEKKKWKQIRRMTRNHPMMCICFKYFVGRLFCFIPFWTKASIVLIIRRLYSVSYRKLKLWRSALSVQHWQRESQ